MKPVEDKSKPKGPGDKKKKLESKLTSGKKAPDGLNPKTAKRLGSKLVIQKKKK